MTDSTQLSAEQERVYMAVLTTAIDNQNRLATSYASRGRAAELGLYLLVQSRATLAYFERVVPPDSLKPVHSTFLEWQRAGVQVLAAELRRHDPRPPKTARPYSDASRAFIAALHTLPQATDAANPA